MNHAIALFAKTPALTPVKTRLAVDIGQDKADQIYTLCVDSLQEVLAKFQQEHNDCLIYWAIAEENGKEHIFWQNRPFEKLWTGNGDLGTRLFKVHNHLMDKHKSVTLIGTDSPQLSMYDLNESLKVLKKYGGVIGPAHDGGYYLFGSSFEIKQHIWESTPYSQENTRDIFINKLDKNIYTLEAKSDLDTIEDIKKILNEMPEKKQPSQKRLITKIESL